jgi:hypothetical protein
MFSLRGSNKITLSQEDYNLLEAEYYPSGVEKNVVDYRY